MTMSNLRYDPDFVQAIAGQTGGIMPVAEDALQLRTTVNNIMGFIAARLPLDPSVQETTLNFTAKDGTTLPLYKFTPANVAAGGQSGPRPAILFVHGGGMVAGSVALFKNDITSFAAATGIVIYGVGYRLAPEFPFPTPIEDVYASFEWLREHSAEEGIDPARIAICGASAGGGIAAGVSLMARDKGMTPPLAKQILIYPMIDDKTEVGATDPLSQFLTWTSSNNTLGWGAYLGDDKGKVSVSPYAAPARATDLSGLPRTYIDVGGLDLFRDEDIVFAAKLAAANVDVEFHLYPGLPHGWESAAPGIPVTKRAMQNRVAAMLDF